MNEAAETIRAAATEETNIIFGATIDERLAGQVWVTVVATGLGKAPRRQSSLPAAAKAASPEPSSPDDTLEPPSFVKSF